MQCIMAGCKVSDESNGFYLSFLYIQHALMARCLSERTCICVNGKILKENKYEKRSETENERDDKREKSNK